MVQNVQSLEMSAKKKKESISINKGNEQTKERLHSDIPKSDIYHEELNQHLLGQIKSLTSENCDLRLFIKERDCQKEELLKTISSLKEDIKNVISTGGPSVSAKSAGVISSKITELCKQNRHTVAELESFKTKYAALERKLIENENKTSENKESKLTEEIVIPGPDELKDLREKLANATKKLIDSRNKQADLKNELLLANKCLQNEIGPSFVSIQKLAMEPVGFKGRAQEIILLKNKISELEEKMFGKNKTILTELKKENYQVIREIEARRRNQIDKTAKDLKDLQNEYAEVKKRLEGSIARIKVLNCEGVTLRQTIQCLSDKSSHDDKLKEELVLQQKAVEKQYQDLLKDISNTNENMRTSHSSIADELKNEKFRVNALNEKLEEKNKKINYLNDQLTNVIESSLQKVYFTPLQIAADNEIKILAGLLDKTNKRLDDERRRYMDLEKKYLRMKSNQSAMNKKLSELDTETKEIKISGHKTRSLVTVGSSLHKTSSAQYTVKATVKGEAVENGCNCKRFEIETLNNKLEIAREQIKFLETQHKMLEDERAADFECIDEMIVNSKKVFANALKKFQEGR